MKKQKILAMLVVIAMVFNICFPTIIKAVEETDYLSVSQFDDSGFGAYGDRLKITVGSETVTDGFYWEECEIGSQVTVEYIVPDGYHFMGWYDYYNGDTLVSTSNPYTFTFEEYTDLRGRIDREDGKHAFLDCRPQSADFGWNMPNYSLDYQTVTVTNEGNVTIEDVEAYSPFDEVEVQCESITLEPGQSTTIQVKPPEEKYLIEEYKQSGHYVLSGWVMDNGTRVYYTTDAYIEIGVSADGENPHGNESPELIVKIEGFDQKPNQGDYLPEWVARGDNGNTRVVPEGTHWEMYNKYENEWGMAPGEPISDGWYRYMVEVAVSGLYDAEDIDVLYTGDGIEPNTYNYMEIDRTVQDPQSVQTYVYAYTNEVDFGENDEYITARYDAGGGTPGQYFSETAQFAKGSTIYVLNPSPEVITPPEGKIFDGYVVNGTRYYVGQSIVANEDLNIGYVWIDDPYADYTPIYNAHLTLLPPEVGATNEAREVELGGYGYTEGSIKPEVFTQPDEEIIVTSAEWVKGTYVTAGDEYQDIFEGTFVEGTYYYALINFEAKDGYVLDNNIEITINNESPAEIFGIYDRTSTMVIGRIAAGDVQPPERQGDQIQIWKTNGGQISVDYTPSEPNVYNMPSKDPSNWMNGGEVVQFYKGDSITVSARPNPGYEFVGWYHVDIQWAPNSSPDDPHHLPYQGEAISTDTSYTYQPSVTVVPGDSEPLRYVCARFEPTEPVDPTVVVHTVFMNGGGSYQVRYNTDDPEEQAKQNKDMTSSGFFAVPEGNTMTLMAKAEDGYVFKGWYKTHEENGNTWVLDEMVSNKPNYIFTPTGYPYLTPVFEEEDPSQYLKGDLDRNGVVDANDASVALELYKAQSATAEDVRIGDMDDNELIDANDASLILEYYKTHQ